MGQIAGARLPVPVEDSSRFFPFFTAIEPGDFPLIWSTMRGSMEPGWRHPDLTSRLPP